MIGMNVFSQVIFLIFIILLLFILYLVAYRAARLPFNNPRQYLKSPKFNQDSDKKVMVCLGDSLTHGHVGVSFVDILRDEIGDSVEIVNAGINSEHTYNVIKRLERIIEIKPDYVVLLIGTNDINNQLTKFNACIGKYLMRLPKYPDEGFFLKYYRQILERLKFETDAEIAVLSIPTITEDPEHYAYAESRRYSCLIKEMSEVFNVTYLPLFEKMDAILTQNENIPPLRYEKQFWQQISLLILHYLFGISFNRIAEKRGFLLHVDQLHLNKQGAEIVKNLILDFYKTSN